MRPGDHPAFFRLPAPEGRSRESALRLAADGTFFDGAEPIQHPLLARAMHTWIRKHPDDGRFILSNGYAWTYLTVEDAPFMVLRLGGSPAGSPDQLILTLNDCTEEVWDPARSRVGREGALYVEVKAALPGGPFDAKLTRQAQSDLGFYLEEVNGHIVVRVGSTVQRMGSSGGQLT